jgi:hypothetical protein
MLPRSMISVSNKLHSMLVQSVEMITGIGDDVSMNAEQLEILQDAVLELFLRLGGVGIVETNAQLSLVMLRKVLVEHGSLGVAGGVWVEGMWEDAMRELGL